VITLKATDVREEIPASGDDKATDTRGVAVQDREALSGAIQDVLAAMAEFRRRCGCAQSIGGRSASGMAQSARA
jgi:hypothetical protein